MEIEPLTRVSLDTVLERMGKPFLVSPAVESIVEEYSGKVPDLLVDVWRTAGFSGYADGLLWLCNPDEWLPVLDDWLSGLELPFRDEWIPFQRTAFGSITMWGPRTGRSLTIEPNYGMIVPIDQSAKMIDPLDIDIQILGGVRADPEVLDNNGDDGKPMFNRVRKRLGDLDTSTMYGCVPALALGGSFTPRGVGIVNAIDHLRFLRTVTTPQVMNWKF